MGSVVREYLAGSHEPTESVKWAADVVQGGPDFRVKKSDVVRIVNGVKLAALLEEHLNAVIQPQGFSLSAHRIFAGMIPEPIIDGRLYRLW
jgi:hypothetical protein